MFDGPRRTRRPSANRRAKSGSERGDGHDGEERGGGGEDREETGRRETGPEWAEQVRRRWMNQGRGEKRKECGGGCGRLQ